MTARSHSGGLQILYYLWWKIFSKTIMLLEMRRKLVLHMLKIFILEKNRQEFKIREFY